MQDQGKRFSGKTVIVTGGASGIGRAAVLLLASEGANVGILDRSVTGASDTVAEVEAAGGKAMAVAVDITVSADVDAAFQSVVNAFGALHSMINCAGIVGGATAADTDDALWQRNISINLDGAFFCCRAALKHLQSGGSIVNIGSITGIHPGIGRAAYAAAKAGVHGLTRSIAVDYAKAGIRANSVAPGPVFTPLTRERFAAPEIGAKIAAAVPLGRYAQPEEIAKPAIFLASEDANFITGQILIADGGFTVP
ncbi:SDR family NAD(P)-dependent oxidoreductase [Phyllobacterium sp. SB3]|uniref:SDR family NAD(P)-dependent oxidoreductase n=1 Tax=Phyllobacterium sp. SB3 TaxID=3156073 RepID=UPI0032AF9617